MLISSSSTNQQGWSPKRLLHIEHKFVSKEGDLMTSEQKELLKKDNLLNSFKRQKEGFDNLKAGYEDLKQEIQDLKDRQAEIQHEITSLEGEKSEHSVKIKGLELQEKALGKLIAKKTKALEGLNTAISKLESDIVLLEKKIQELQSDAGKEAEKSPQLQQAKEEADKKIEESKKFGKVWKALAQMRSYDHSLLGLDPAKFAKVAEIGEKKRGEHGARLLEAEKKIAELTRDLEKNAAEITRIANELKTTSGLKTEKAAAKAGKEGERDVLEPKIMALEAKKTTVTERLDQVREAFNAAAKNIAGLEDESTANVSAIAKKEKLAKEKESRIEKSKEALVKIISAVETLLQLRETDIYRVDSRVIKEFFDALEGQMTSILPFLESVIDAIPVLSGLREKLDRIKANPIDRNGTNLSKVIGDYLENNIAMVIDEMLDTISREQLNDQDTQDVVETLKAIQTALKGTEKLAKRIMMVVSENADQTIKKLTPRQLQAYRDDIAEVKSLLE